MYKFLKQRGLKINFWRLTFAVNIILDLSNTESLSDYMYVTRTYFSFGMTGSQTASLSHVPVMQNTFTFVVIASVKPLDIEVRLRHVLKRIKNNFNSFY